VDRGVEHECDGQTDGQTFCKLLLHCAVKILLCAARKWNK